MEKKNFSQGHDAKDYYLSQKGGTNDVELEVITQNVMVSMRDNIRLSTDIYLPAIEGTKFPALIARSPYNKSGARKQAIYLAQQGYAVLAQDVRGRYDSEGIFYPFSDHYDGYDTIEWTAAQNWCDGNVGTFGASALGAVQFRAALLQPPHLKAMFIEVATADLYEDLYYNGGAFKQMGVQGWMNAMNMLQVQRLLPEKEANQALETMSKLLSDQMAYLQEMHTPLKDFPYLTRELMPVYSDVLRLEILNHQDPSYEWIDSNTIMNKLNRISVPVFHIGGFMDLFASGTIKAFQNLQENGGPDAKGKQKLLMGPWTHSTYGRGGGDTPWAENAQIGINDLMIRWFDYWLKGTETGIMQEPAIRYYVTGKNDWEDAAAWPLHNTTAVPYYLRGIKSGTINSLNDGQLSVHPPGTEIPDSYVYDPMKPISTVGGNNPANPPVITGPREQSAVEPAVLTYTSEVLRDDTKMVGPVQAKLYASSSTVDTDFTVKLTDVSPDGISVNVTDGIIRAKFREGQSQSVLLIPGQIYEFHIQLTPISHMFKAGHRIRVQVSSSNYPKYNRNLNNGQSLSEGRNEDAVVALNTIYHDPAHSSCILLPIVKD